MTHQPSRRRLLAALPPAIALGLVAPALAVTDEQRRLRPRICPQQDCGWVYNPRLGDPDGGIPPGVAFDDLPGDWQCPQCTKPKSEWPSR